MADPKPDETWNLAAYEILMNMRGWPDQCDFCRQPFVGGRYPVPEEAGETACNVCEARWNDQEQTT